MPSHQPRIPGKTVYFIGSGFSKPYGLPVIADFLEEGMAYIKRSGQTSLAHRMMRLLDEYIPPLRMVCNHEDCPSIADLFCMIDLLEPRPQFRRTLEEFVVAVCRKNVAREPSGRATGPWAQPHVQVEGYLSTLRPKGRHRESMGNTVSAYEAFVSHLLQPGPWKSRPAVISLNYDLVIEQTVSHLAARYGAGLNGKAPLNISYGDRIRIGHTCRHCRTRCQLLVGLSASGPGTLHLIKLHGSINWQAHPPTGVSVHSCLPDRARVSPGRNTLIWPSWLRGSFTDFYAELLAEARRELKLASEIVIIGYSMPALDRYIKYLFADVLSTPELPSVTICGHAAEDDLRAAWAAFAGTLGQKVKLRVFSSGFVPYCQELLTQHQHSAL